MVLTRYKKLNELNKRNRVELLVSGFGLQKVVEVDDVINRILTLPTEHFDKIKVIKYDPKRQVSFLIRHQRVGRQLGEYLGSFNSIVVYDFKSREECFHVLMHEIGHHVYFRVLSSQQKKFWVTELYRAEPGVTELGKKNACEDFAEAYALFLNNPESIRDKPLKNGFIAKLFKF
jgi:hypothetical protein